MAERASARADVLWLLSGIVRLALEGRVARDDEAIPAGRVADHPDVVRPGARRHEVADRLRGVLRIRRAHAQEVARCDIEQHEADISGVGTVAIDDEAPRFA